MFTTSGRHKQTTRRGGGDTAPRKEKVHTMRTELPENVYIVYALYKDGTEGILSFEYNRYEAVDYCRRMQERMECNVYVREYTKSGDIIVL